MWKGHNNNNGGKIMMMMNRGMKGSYGFIFLLVIGAAIFGVMVLHKHREKRIFDLLIKEKDQQLFSLDLLLQKEMDYGKETKRKTEEMRAKIYSLRTQKMNLDNRVLEMRSTISSMKDEQRTMEMALQEKQDEIKRLDMREIDCSKVTPIAEIKSIEQHIERPVKVWSINADDPSNPGVNSTEAGKNKETDAKSVKYIDGSGNESANNSNGVTSKQGTDGRENEGEIAVRRAMTGEEQPGGNKVFVEVGKSRDADSETDRRLEETASSVQIEGDKSGVKYRSGIKLQTADRHTSRHSNKGKGKGKKLRNSAKTRLLKNRAKQEEIGIVRIGGRGFFKGALGNERNKTQQDVKPIGNELQGIDERVVLGHENEKSVLDGENAKEKQLAAKTADGSAEVKLPNPEVPTVTRNMSDERGNRNTNQPVEDEQEIHVNYITSEKYRIPFDKKQLTRTVDGEGTGIVEGEGNRATEDAIKDNQVEDGQSDEEAGEIHKDIDQRDKDSQQGQTSEKDEEPEDLEAEDDQKSDTDMSRQSSSILQEDREEYKEQADEPDF